MHYLKDEKELVRISSPDLDDDQDDSYEEGSRSASHLCATCRQPKSGRHKCQAHLAYFKRFKRN